MEDKVITLKDGRNIGYTSFGDVAGEPVLFFHGSPGSRYEAGVAEEVAENHQIHLIGVDRPGYGQSDKNGNSSINGWAQDIEELLNALQIDKLDIVGVSGGAPYTLACAEQLNSRLKNVAVVCGLIPVDSEEGIDFISEQEQALFKAAKHAPEQIAHQLKQIHNNPEAMAKESSSHFTEFDQSVLSSELLQKWLKSIKEATRHPDGMISDYSLFGQPWGVNLNNIKVPVYFWHGDQDETIGLSGVKAFVQEIPGAKLEVIEGAGHIGTGIVGTESALKLFANG